MAFSDLRGVRDIRQLFPEVIGLHGADQAPLVEEHGPLVGIEVPKHAGPAPRWTDVLAPIWSELRHWAVWWVPARDVVEEAHAKFSSAIPEERESLPGLGRRDTRHDPPERGKAPK